MSDLASAIEEDFEEESDDVLPFKYSITSYGADYPVDSLVKRMNNGSIYVPPFQRGYVWKIRQASRFIESLLLGLPVPGIFLAREQDSQKLLVIDGQQRLCTIQYFYEGVFKSKGTKKEFSLEGVTERFTGITYQTLSEENKRKLDDSILPATIIKQDEPSDDDGSIYHIFERLNTGGEKLKAQEIRACIYHGEFNQLLGELNENSAWRDIYGAVDLRMQDQELILRFLALHFDGENYRKPMKGFLNKFMGGNRHLDLHTGESIKKVFAETVEVAHRCLGKKAFRPRRKINAAVFDAIMVGLSHRLRHGPITDSDSVVEIYQTLLQDDEFRAVTVETARTTEGSTVRDRLDRAIHAFEGVR
jgi:hypothetical protein